MTPLTDGPTKRTRRLGPVIVEVRVSLRHPHGRFRCGDQAGARTPEGFPVDGAEHVDVGMLAGGVVAGVDPFEIAWARV